MTRKEAIDILKHDIYLDKQGMVYCHNAVGIEALEMAIKALEQEPCEDWWDVPSDEMTLEQARQAVKDLRKFVMNNYILPKLQYCEDKE